MHIQLQNISKSFTDGANQERMVLSGLDLNLEKGDFVAITGVSGSGKSTLLNILGTLLRPDNGSYHLDGQDVTLPGTDLHAVRNGKIGMVFQDFRLLPQLNVKQNILLPTLAMKDASTDEENKYADRLMELLNISHLQHQYPEKLSGGEKARVSLCRALIMQPALLLADEPTGQLDCHNAQVIAELLLQLNRELHTTIVMVTHSPDMASVAHRQYRLEAGCLTLNNKPFIIHNS